MILQIIYSSLSYFDVSRNYLKLETYKWFWETASAVICTHMIDFDSSAVVRPICGQMSAEVISYTQYCCGANGQNVNLAMYFDPNQEFLN